MANSEELVNFTYLDLGSLRRNSKDTKIGSAISWDVGSRTISNNVVKPFTTATTLVFSTHSSLNVSIHTLRRLSSLWFDIATRDRANATGNISPKINNDIKLINEKKDYR